MTREAFIGFKSAWGDNKPGSIVWTSFSDRNQIKSCLPKSAFFDDAINVCNELLNCHDFLLIGIDQPTIVENYSGMRPVEKAIGSFIGKLGGGVQPANLKKSKLFGPSAPIGQFLKNIDALQDPMAARVSREGAYLIEVYAVLALTALEPEIMKRNEVARYNPDRFKNFCLDDWRLVTQAVERQTDKFNLSALSKWARSAANISSPRKPEQNKLDAVICLIVALQWRRAMYESVAMIGDLDSGYMITPVSTNTKTILKNSARERDVPYHDTPFAYNVVADSAERK